MSDAGAELDDERAARIAELVPLVRRLAYFVRGRVPGADVDELVGDGMLGLIRAIDTHVHERGASLERYARQVITGAMLNGLRKRDPVSERARRILREADRQAGFFAQQHGRMPGTADLEARCRGTVRAQLAVHHYTPLSLDAPLPPEHRVAAQRDNDPAELVTADAERRRIAAAVAALPQRERRVIELHYRDAVPLRRIGACLAVSPQRASQLHCAALKRLKKALS